MVIVPSMALAHFKLKGYRLLQWGSRKLDHPCPQACSSSSSLSSHIRYSPPSWPGFVVGSWEVVQRGDPHHTTTVTLSVPLGTNATTIVDVLSFTLFHTSSLLSISKLPGMSSKWSFSSTKPRLRRLFLFLSRSDSPSKAHARQSQYSQGPRQLGGLVETCCWPTLPRLWRGDEKKDERTEAKSLVAKLIVISASAFAFASSSSTFPFTIMTNPKTTATKSVVPGSCACT